MLTERFRQAWVTLSRSRHPLLLPPGGDAIAGRPIQRRLLRPRRRLVIPLLHCLRLRAAPHAQTFSWLRGIGRQLATLGEAH